MIRGETSTIDGIILRPDLTGQDSKSGEDGSVGAGQFALEMWICQPRLGLRQIAS